VEHKELKGKQLSEGDKERRRAGIKVFGIEINK